MANLIPIICMYPIQVKSALRPAPGIARGTTLDVMIPGLHPALPVLLELGFRIEDRDVYCAGPSDPVDPERRLLNGGLLRLLNGGLLRLLNGGLL